MRIENIKFRAWDKVSEQMLRIGLIDLENEIIYCAKNNEDKTQSYSTEPLPHNFSNVERLVFIQYTGISDKNGNDIYEKDLLKNTQTNKIYKVVWNGTSAAFELENEEKKYMSLFFANQNFGRYEIIGNIYENPEEVQ